MKIEIRKLDSLNGNFLNEFSEYKEQFLAIISNAYPSYYGDEYQLNRIISGKSILYLCFADNLLVGVSYVKRNLRRGGTAVFPEEYRRSGLAEMLVKVSFDEFPNQYTILNSNNTKMLSLMKKLQFQQPTSIEEIKQIVGDEFSQLSSFEFSGEYLLFKRQSLVREMEREQLTLLYKFNDV